MGLMVRRARVPARPTSVPETFPAFVTPFSRGNQPGPPHEVQCVSFRFSPFASRPDVPDPASFPRAFLSHPQTKADAGISAFPDGDNIFNWVGTIEGAAGTVRLDPPHRARPASPSPLA